MRRLTLSVLAVIFFASIAMSTDLFHVSVSSKPQAEALADLSLDVLLRLHDGYLVLADNAPLPALTAAGLEPRLLTTAIDRSQLALDISRENLDRQDYEVIYESDGLRVLRVDPSDLVMADDSRGLAPVPVAPAKIVYNEPHSLLTELAEFGIDLDSLISLVSEDSMRSYVEHIQNFTKRTAGSASNEACRDWLVAKMQEFGYDNILLDPFPTGFMRGSSDAHNICVTKTGSEFPWLEILVGAHFDVVGDYYSPACPGADDNGSGCAGVLEMARILKNIDTRLSITFIFFNAEEVGLYGAAHYAAAAAERGDRILYMQNMDMIGNYENDTGAYVRGCPAYTELWAYLADSLEAIDISATILSENRCDDLPFFQNGFDAIGLEEFIFSDHYHTTHDSAVYVSFEYLSRMIMGTLATAYAVDQSYDPPPGLLFSYPEGRPALLFPGQPTTIRVGVQGFAGGQPIAGTGALRYVLPGESFLSVPLVNIGDDLYEATIPAQPSFTRVSYQILMQEVSTGRCFDPPGGSLHVGVAATSVDTVLADDFEQDYGWTVSGFVTEGEWVCSIPYFWGMLYGAPGWDASGTGRCFFTGQQYSIMINEVNDGTTILTSPLLDLQTEMARIGYRRWFYTSAPEEVFTVWISGNNGDTWELIETVGPDVNTSGGWSEHSFWVNDFIAPVSQVLVKFEATDEGIDQIVEAAIDNFVVEQFVSEPLPRITTEVLPDWTVNIPYSGQLTSTGGYGTITWTDVLGGLAGTGLTLTTEGLVTGTPTAAGDVSLTVRATDELAQSDEKLLTFHLNPVLSIITDSLPDASQGVPYSFQLLSEGGTGQSHWSITDYGLKYSGLTLSPAGLLSGTPYISGERAFTARVADTFGSEDEKLLVVQFNLDFICGDADFSGTDVNISDLTYFVDYMFGGGPAPPIENAVDVDGSGIIDVSDVTYLVDYLFGEGAAPDCR